MSFKITAQPAQTPFAPISWLNVNEKFRVGLSAPKEVRGEPASAPESRGHLASAELHKPLWNRPEMAERVSGVFLVLRSSCVSLSLSIYLISLFSSLPLDISEAGRKKLGPHLSVEFKKITWHVTTTECDKQRDSNAGNDTRTKLEAIMQMAPEWSLQHSSSACNVRTGL